MLATVRAAFLLVVAVLFLTVACDEDVSDNNTVYAMSEPPLLHSSENAERVLNTFVAPEGTSTSQCTHTKLTFTHAIQGMTVNETKIPYSRINLDGASCGPFGANASETELAYEDYVQVLSSEFLATLKTQGDAYAEAFPSMFYRALQKDYSVNIRNIIEFLGKRETSHVHVGFLPWSDMTCSNNRSVPRSSFLLFIEDTAEIGLTDVIETSYIVEPSRPFVLTYAPEQYQACVFVGPKKSPDVNAAPAPKPPSLSKQQCFPASAIVTTGGNKNRIMRDLDIGDSVWTPSSSNSTIFAPSPILFYTHRLSQGVFSFVRLRTISNESVTLTSGHYVHTTNGLKPANEVTIKDSLLRYTGKRLQKEPVISIEEKLDVGLYNPQSASGNMIVDGFLVSCYTTALHPTLAHILVTRFGYLIHSIMKLQRHSSIRTIGSILGQISVSQR